MPRNFQDEAHSFKNEDRVSHKVKGLGTVTTTPRQDDLVVTAPREAVVNSVYVVWDDARFPVAPVPSDELERVPDASAAISTGV